MSTIHFVGGEKGGVGKSVLSRLLSQYFLDKSQPYIGLDADQSHPTLSRYYADYTRNINLDHFESIDQIMELALEDDCNVLIDLPAQSERFLDRWIEENGVIDMCQEMDIKLVYWYAVDSGPDSVNLLDNFLSKYSQQLSVIVAKNQGRGTDFSNIEALAPLQGFDPSVKPVAQFYIPALHTSTMQKIEKLGLSFWAAANLKDNDVPHLGLMERQRAKVWVNKVQNTLEWLINGL
ncbi:mobilization protein MobD [Amphritea sp. 1_MG-2023]|uniref:mobilization protein MobD n=1 Tax=Amphritea sp. 1_MG-2023 TaxID=3062670 RepID=UPI0026E42EB1|nr:mobilization protein MobD [Amphritea sp. 1_MG-2023]MDO6563608.1 mobilization protein MobD [Amphritea sp. 1_MG-2023]